MSHTITIPDSVTCSQEENGSTRHTHASELTAGQPVLLDGGTVAYATGYDVGGCFELRLYSTTGPIVTVKTVTPTTPELLNRHRALMSAAYLNLSLSAIAQEAQAEGTTDPTDIEGLDHCRNAVSTVAGNVGHLTY